MATQLVKPTVSSNTSESIVIENTQPTYANSLKINKSRARAPIMSPKKEDAIIFPIAEDVTNENYAEAMLQSVKPEQIRFVSRLSNGRLSIYLDSKNTVDEFMQNTGFILVNNMKLVACRLINPAKKLIISNINPYIEKALKTLGLQLNSPIVYLNAGFSNTVLKHVLSFQRSVYISCGNGENEPDIPSSIIIKHEEEESRIFLNSEQTIRCFMCKQEGHLARNCTSVPTNENTPEILIDNNNDQNPNLKRQSPPSTVDSMPENKIESQKEMKRPSKKTKKDEKIPKPILAYYISGKPSTSNTH